MAVADPETELASIPRWGVSLTGRFLAAVIVWGLMIIAISAPALHFVPTVYPKSTPFLWLTIAGLVIAMSNPDLSEEDGETLNDLIERVRNNDRRERFFYMTTVIILAIATVSFEVAVVGVGASLIAEETGLGLVAVATTLWYPTVDSWVGRNVGWNVASVGGLVALLAMHLLAIMYQVSPEVPRSAADDFRNTLVSR